MTKSQAEAIKTRVEELNTLYSPIELTFKMGESVHPYVDDEWFVTIVCNYTKNDWMVFYGMNHNYAQVIDKLAGFQFALEAVQAYQEEYGDLKFSHSDLPLG
jgi:hypothetical protein